MAVKGWLSLLISVLALIVSLAAAYITAFRQIDDLQAIVKPVEIASANRNDPTTAEIEVQIAFANGGTRSAAVTEIGYYLFFTPSTKREDECNHDAQETQQYIPPFTVEAGKIVTQIITIPTSIYSKSASQAPSDSEFVACLRVSIVVPQHDLIIKKFKFANGIWHTRGGMRLDNADKSTNISLFHNREFIAF